MTDDLTLYTQSEVAEYLKNSPKTLESWRQKGGGPNFKKIGRRVYYTKIEIINFVNKNSFNSTSQY